MQKGADGLGFLLGTALFSVLPTLFEMAVVVAIVASHYDSAFVLAIAATFACYATWTAIYTRRRPGSVHLGNRLANVPFRSQCKE